MNSRRVITRSSSGEGRSNSHNGDDVSGSSRSSSRSYLSNVRPENSCSSHRYSQYRPTRSTFCSVMAQLTEDTQPSFEKTLKSKAVSENCNVKFTCVVTGNPTPDIIWYKDDMQLDRYCGLPKYEIFRNGQNHSLQIYNCTVEDAAIYQASARNIKGIVSCSGVLEVGVMNEFKIHQRYFAKLKQKAENKRRELEGKENQGPGHPEGKENQGPLHQEQLRPISPDRSQRKRRSPMEASLSTPSSMEDEGSEDSQEVPVAVAEVRLQETTMEDVEEKPGPVTNGAVHPITNGQAVNENGSKGATYIYDPAQKIFTAHQPKTPFAKKKIKISNGAKGVKAERVTEERRANEEASVALTSTESLQSQGPLEEDIMEVESAVNPSALDSDSRKVTEQCQKSATEKVKPVYNMPSEEEKLYVPSQKKQPTVLRSPAAVPSSNHTVSGPECKQAAELQMEAGHKNTEENLESQDPNPTVTSTQLRSSPAVGRQQPLSTVMEDITKTQQEEVTVMQVDKTSAVAERQLKAIVPLMCEGVNVALESTTTQLSNESSDGPLAHRESVDVQRESKDALLQRPCELSRDQLSARETSRCQKNVSVSRPLLLNEVRQAHAQLSRNEAPVNLEPLTTHCDMDAQSPQRSPSGRETTTDDNQTPTLHSPVQAASDKTTQDTWDHSRGSNEKHAVLFTDLQKSPLERPSHGENTPGCNISFTVQQSKVETAIKTVERTEIVEKVDKNVEGNEVGELLVQADNVAPNERIVEMETEIVAVKTSEQGKIEKTREEAEEDIIIVDVSEKETEKNEPVLKRAEESHPESQNLKLNKVETVIPNITKHPENNSIHNTNESEQQIKGFKEIPTHVSKVKSIAELMRSQMKALESTIPNSVTSIPIPADHAQPPPTTATEQSPELRVDHRGCELEVKKSKLDRKTETNTPTPPTNLKATQLEVHRRLAKTDHGHMQSLNAISPIVEALLNPSLSPPISVIDVGGTLETRKLLDSTEKYNDSTMESRALTPVPLKDGPVVLPSRTENVQTDFSPMLPKQELTNRPPSSSNPPVFTSPEHGKPVTSTAIEKASALSPTTKASSPDSMSILQHGNEERFHGKDKGVIQNVTPEIQLISETHLRSTEIDSATLLDQHKEPTTSGSQNIQKFDTESVLVNEKQGINQESSLSMVEAFSKTDSLTPPNTEASPLLRRRNGSSSIPSATPQELASGARRKIVIPKPKSEDNESTSPADNQPQKEEVSPQSSKLSPVPVTLSVSPSLSRRSTLLQPSERSAAAERRSPLLSRRKVAQETPAPNQEPTPPSSTPKTDGKPAEKDKRDPFKAPQVIRKIRGESFSDASGHLKLWCQFFNILSDSTIKWCRDEVEIAQVMRSAGDETQVNLAIVQASSRDCGVYGCTITNEHGTDSTDFLLSVDILAGMSLREDLGVGEEIEMTPLLLNKGVADSGVWANKFFGRIMMQESRIGDGCSHKVWRAKVIYGLEPVFESGTTCIIKARSPVTYGGKEERCLIERNLDIAKQECRIQNLAREYCKIFSAEARVIENFGPTLEVIPVYLIYRPANTIPYATVGADLKGVSLKYSQLDHMDRLVMRAGSEVEQKCCALQHWVHQWTNGNLLLTQLEGVDTKINHVGISVKSTGYQNLSAVGNPKVFEQFVSQHQCNYYCGLLSLRSLKAMDSLMTPSKPKGSRSPLLQRKMGAGSSSPQTGRKAAVSPRLPRKSESVQDSSKASTK